MPIIVLFGHIFALASANIPVPVPMSAMVFGFIPIFFNANNPCRQPRVLPCLPVPKAVAASIFRRWRYGFLSRTLPLDSITNVSWDIASNDFYLFLLQQFILLLPSQNNLDSLLGRTV